MKVLQLLESAATGVGRHVLDLSEGLLARGHEVHLLYSGRRSDEVFHRGLHRLQALRVFEIPMDRRPGLADIPVVREIRRYLHLNGPFDLLHCHSTKAGLVGRLGLIGHASKRLYTPHMFYSMDPLRSGLTQHLVGTLERALSNFCDGVIVVSQEEYAHARTLGIHPRKLCLIRNGVSLDRTLSAGVDRSALRTSWGLSASDVCIGFAGRLVPQKSPGTLLRAFAALPGRVRATTRLAMVGAGPLAPSLRSLATELSIATRIDWLGERDAREVMPAFDILALTSDSEGHSLVVLEAMAHSLPIVATSVGGVTASVHPGVNGFIVPTRGVPEIATALNTLAADAALRARMGKASLELVQHFSLHRMVEETAALYSQVVSGVWKGGAADWKLATD